MKRTAIILTLFILTVLIIPSMIVMPFAEHAEQAAKHDKDVAKAKTKDKTASQNKDKGPAISVSVYRAAEDKVQSFDMHDYLVGVVASEMPADFNIEALKAQTLAARTYIVKHLLNEGSINVPKGAEVTDTTMDQVFKDKADLKKIWGIDYEWKLAKIEKAVNATEGQIITYNGKPITPSFFSTSNGYTENAEDYWSNPYPYLKSVPSPWDRNSPKYEDVTTRSASDVENKLGIDFSKQKGEIGDIIDRTKGHRVAKIKVGGKTFTGREIREKLGLRSTDFNIVKQGDEVKITTKGYGHGVGMSQYGANGMAKAGDNYKQIVSYYYKGVDISNIQPFTAKLTAKK
ncbi:stage II sporulation protein D [Scopulibacillus darangshiensis]|uniref:Stage II sporulation protein D n=1 Tax=Scopulibacillus darangshiensis TaxID=442528 RepID=A0A4R2NGI4_9BACL|nr:stage II sporulation protein D [Scopulibacillus darangshiensis]TCP20265.1 stage II sporulation protein D [Scopulibacillus darangshiensis]